MKKVVAPMAGTVFQILVSKGESIAPGQVALILESMKMEIPVECEDSGTVIEIAVQEGDFVNEGDLLITIE
jgi:Biotin-requiring enzyme.